MSLLDRTAFRLLYAMEEEERAWVIYGPAPLGDLRYTVTDECRLRRWDPLKGDDPLPELYVEHSRFKTRSEAEHYIRYRSIRAGLMYALCFWRKDP